MIESIITNTPLRTVPVDYCPPGSANWFTIPSGLDAGKTLFYFDARIGPAVEDQAAATVLFVHGNPECSYTYRGIRKALEASEKPLRLVAMDHVGFGLSDQATFEMVDMHHAANVELFVRHLDLRDLTLVIHDWGGPIGAGALASEPDRVRNLLLMNTTIFPMPPDGLTYENFPIPWFPWCKVPKFVPDALWGAVAANVVSHGEPQSDVRFLFNAMRMLAKYGLGLIPEGTPEWVWSMQLSSQANAKSSKRNVLQTPVWGHGYRYTDPLHGEQDNHEFYRRMQDVIPQAWGSAGRNIDVAGYFGAWDVCGKESVIAQWQAALPKMAERTFRFPDVGHFIEEYKGEEMAATILEMNGLT